MIECLDKLIHALRDELKEYGELLALLDQEFDSQIAANDALQTVAAIHTQTARIHTAREHREKCRRHLAMQAELPADATFHRLIPLMPKAHGGLVQALVEENNHLLLRVQKSASQNLLLPSRSLELMQGFLGTLAPAKSWRCPTSPVAQPRSEAS